MLSLMAKEFFAKSPVLAYPVAALLIFFVVFTVISVRTMRKPKAALDALARLPLEEVDHGR